MLTEREKECTRLASDGLSSKEISKAIGISQKTVEAHLKAARNKLNARNTANLISIAHRSGIITGFLLLCSISSCFGTVDAIRPSRAKSRIVRTVRNHRTKHEWDIIV